MLGCGQEQHVVISTSDLCMSIHSHAHPHSCEQRYTHVQHHRHTYVNIKHSESLYRGKDKVPSSTPTPSAHLSQDPRPADDSIQLTSWCKQDVVPSPEVNQGLLISKFFCKLRRMILRAFSISHSMNATKVTAP